MRIEIVKQTNDPDKDPLITWLWDALYPLFEKTKGKIMVFMSNDLGPNGNERGMVVCIEGLKTTEVRLRKTIESNPTSRNYQEEI